MSEFEETFVNENLEIKDNTSWKKAFWTFGDGSMFIFVNVDYAKSHCFVKEVSSGQNDQDQD